MFPYGILVVDGETRVLEANEQAERLLGEVNHGATCCSLLGCRLPDSPLGDRCFSELAREQERILPEVRVDLPEDRPVSALWVTAGPLEDGRVVIEVRLGASGDRRRRTTPHWVGGPRLRIYTLGRTRIESGEGPIEGRWLERRSGQLLKFLVCERGRFVHPDEIAEALRPGSQIDTTSNVRYFIHTLRGQLQPDRPKRGTSSFVVSARGGYALDRRNVWIDADSFEHDVETAMGALARDDTTAAEAAFERAVERYDGDFLADEPYAQWVLPERDRLRALASDSLDALVTLRLRERDIDGAFPLMDRLADLQPYDMAVQRRRIAITLLRGRRSDAVRQYDALRRRMQDMFGERPSFRLADVHDDEAFA